MKRPANAGLFAFTGHEMAEKVAAEVEGTYPELVSACIMLSCKPDAEAIVIFRASWK